VSPPAKTLRQRLDQKSTSISVVVTALLTFLGTSGGFKLVDRLAPRTGERLARIEVCQESHTGKLDAILRSQEAMTRAMWRAGIRVGTNEIPE